MYRNGIGYISFLWGFPGTSEKDFHDGYGISHIIAARNAQGADGEAVARKLVEVIARGQVFTDKRGNQESKITISHDGYVAILKSSQMEGQKIWLLTGYKKTSSGDKQAVKAQQATQLNQIDFSETVGAEDVEGTIPHNVPELNTLVHAIKEQTLGSTTFDASGNYVIQLFRGANLSTLTHETAHVFFLEMERLEREGLADERMLADLAALREWTAAMDDDAALKAEYDRYQKHSAYGGAEFDALPDYLKEDARSRAKQEMLARGFEQYLREGKAPSPQLEGVFARFRKWLMRVYRDALDLHVELSDEVRDVFDRMLAHEEEMDLRAEDDALERSAIEGELERLRAEMTRAVTSAPHLMGQITSNTDAETSVGQYVDAQLGLIVRRARELARMGVPVSDTLSRVSFQGLVKDEYGRMVTLEEADALAQRNAQEEALAPFWDTVWGRLNADSLRVDFPDARREPAYQHGRGLFAGKGEGLAVDELADELKNRGLLEEEADSSTLIERLKGMQRPDRRTRGKVFFQPLNAGVNLERLVSATTIQRKYPASTLKEKRKAVIAGERERVVKAFKDGIRNKDTGWLVTMSKSDFDEHLKFDMESVSLAEQYEAVAALPELTQKAFLVESHKDSHGRSEVKQIHRFYAPLTIGNDTYSVLLTMKEFQNGILGFDTVSPIKLYHHRLAKKCFPLHVEPQLCRKAPIPKREALRDIHYVTFSMQSMITMAARISKRERKPGSKTISPCGKRR